MPPDDPTITTTPATPGPDPAPVADQDAVPPSAAARAVSVRSQVRRADTVRRTKIVAPLGPASETDVALGGLIAAGVDVVRLNLSHGTVEQHLERLATVRRLAAAAGRHVGVLVDLPGPKVRSGVFPEGGVHLHVGDRVRLVPGDGDADGPCSADRIIVEYPTLLDDICPGDHVILGDGAITLVIEEIEEYAAVGRILAGGRVQGRPGVHIPAERIRLTAPTAEDLTLLARMLPAEPDFVAVSFVRSAADIEKVRTAMGPYGEIGRGPMIVAKIETAPAIAALEEILDATDAVMVARGDLGIECPLEDVPHVQKHVIRSCVAAGVPVITATQMLESMIGSPSPTRAEVSDVANAVFDGTDAVMLSAETAIGIDPVNVVETMARIAIRAEREADYAQWAARLGREQRQRGHSGSKAVTAAMTHAAWQAATDVRAVAVLCCTRSGLTVRGMARFRPAATLIGLANSERTARQLTLTWGVRPLRVDTYSSTDEMVWFAVEAAVQHQYLLTGDVIAVLAGAPDAPDGATDVLRIVNVR